MELFDLDFPDYDSSEELHESGIDVFDLPEYAEYKAENIDEIEDILLNNHLVGTQSTWDEVGMYMNEIFAQVESAATPADYMAPTLAAAGIKLDPRLAKRKGSYLTDRANKTWAYGTFEDALVFYYKRLRACKTVSDFESFYVRFFTKTAPHIQFEIEPLRGSNYNTPGLHLSDYNKTGEHAIIQFGLQYFLKALEVYGFTPTEFEVPEDFDGETYDY